MKIVFIIYRINYYRFFSPLIQEALNRGYKVECWNNYGRQGKYGVKTYAAPRLEDMPVFNPDNKQLKAKILYSDAELEKELLQQKDIDAVVSIHTPNCYLTQGALKSKPFLWCTLYSGTDSFVELAATLQEKKEHRLEDIFFVNSDTFLGIGKDYLKTFYPKCSYLLEEKYRKINITGTIEFDSFKGIDQEEVRKKYKIPKDKSLFLYLPFAYLNNSVWENAFCGFLINTAKAINGSYIHTKKEPLLNNLIHKARCLKQIMKDRLAFQYWIKGIDEARVFKAVRDFCDKNNLYLVVKPRLKYPLAEKVKRNADLVVWDTEKQQNPSILMELLTITRVATAFFSSSVLTSAFANVYHLNMLLPDGYFNYEDIEKFWYPIDKYSLYNFPGVCESWSIEDVINKLGSTPLERFVIDPAQRAKYVEKYIGFDDFHSSERFFDALEEQALERKVSKINE